MSTSLITLPKWTCFFSATYALITGVRFTTHESKKCHSAILGEGGDILVPMALANEVDNDIHTLSVRYLADFLRKVLRFVVDTVRRTIRHF